MGSMAVFVVHLRAAPMHSRFSGVRDERIIPVRLRQPGRCSDGVRPAAVIKIKDKSKKTKVV